MLVEYLLYSATFVITSGIAVLGILVSWQLYQSEKKPVLQTLLYQQIFIFSFFIYGIWGNIIIREIVADLPSYSEFYQKLAIFIPILGIPFLMVGWFMQLKFGFNLSGYTISKRFISCYFPAFILVISVPAVLIQKGKITENPDQIIIRFFLVLNLFIQFVFAYPFLKPKENILMKQFGIQKKTIGIYMAGVFMYSLVFLFFNIFGYISTCISLLFLFAAHTFFPLYIRMKLFPEPSAKGTADMDFHSFCSFYEISKREAEIILEICTGKSNQAISDTLFITLQTVKDHTHRIYTKTGVKSRVQLANLVREKTGTGM
jgi:DNA-binding CsgD family transcriptional regulator